MIQTTSTINLNTLVAPSLAFIGVIEKLAIEREKKKTNKDAMITKIEDKGQQEVVLSWLLYLVVNCELSTIKKQSIYLLDKALRTYGTAHTYNQDIVESIFNVLISTNNNKNDSDESQTMLISILNILNVGFTKKQYLDYLKLLENTIRKNRDNQAIREIILKIMESIDTKQVQLVALKDKSIDIFNNIMSSFLTDTSNVQYQLRAIGVIRSTSEMMVDKYGRKSIVENDYDLCEFCIPHFEFSNEQVIQHLLDLIEWYNNQSNGYAYGWEKFIGYIDPTQYKYVSSRIFPMMLKRLYKADHDKQDAVDIIQSVGEKMGMRYYARYRFELVQHLLETKQEEYIDLVYWSYRETNWSYFSIYLPSLMKQLINRFDQLKDSQKEHCLKFLFRTRMMECGGMIDIVHPYFRHLVDHVCKLGDVHMMCNMVNVAAAKEGISQNSQLLFNRFIKVLMDPSTLAKDAWSPWGSRIYAMERMIDTMQGGVWKSDQIQVFTKYDNEYCQILECPSKKRESQPNKANQFLDVELTAWTRIHWILYYICFPRHSNNYNNNKEIQTVIREITRASLDEFITKAPTFGKYSYLVPTMMYKWAFLCQIDKQQQQDMVKVVIDYYPKIVPLLLVKDMLFTSDQLEQIDGHRSMAKLFWNIIKILVHEQQQQQQQCQIHLDKIHQMMIDFNEEILCHLPDHFCVLLDELWCIHEYQGDKDKDHNDDDEDDQDDDEDVERLFNQFITKVDDDNYLLKKKTK
ncbi:hypothetical protein DFA_10699 [Cavenderia fasciculata]|uniref:Uncharacterized protein n=1 Tax=Cavenderia fasciculata TaxID=261658 RepID=F4QB54_CACFS|nr:uncharacterized protein DFA_10699 [Cavenderia fasciculata]EGG14826.1 hypothetical protein DFA_10699 [Cavenderia fasciculata]|eukprot:XP_004351342.1 hypothetical protein DFA_10699 [Cavenderia fasciculata]